MAPKSGKTTKPSVNYHGPPSKATQKPIQPGVASGVRPTGKGSNPKTK